MRLGRHAIVLVALSLGACASNSGNVDASQTSGVAHTWTFEFEDGGAEVVSAPRITAFAGQRFNVHIAKTTDFVSGYQDDDAATPITDTVREGLFVDGKSIPRDDGAVSLRIALRSEAPVFPFASSTQRVGGRDLPVETPEVVTLTSQGTLRVVPGRRTALAAVPSADGSRVVTLWGEVTIVRDLDMSEIGIAAFPGDDIGLE